MKRITTTLMVLGTLTLGLADANIDAQISEIRNAPAQDRVKLTNEFKQQIATMNKEDRSEAISKLQVQMRSEQGNANSENSEHQMGENEHQEKNMPEHEEMSNMPEHEGMSNMPEPAEMHHMEDMNQNQAGQLMQEQENIHHEQEDEHNMDNTRH